MTSEQTYFAFAGSQLLARGDLASVGCALQQAANAQCQERLSLYAEGNGAPLDIDLTGSQQELLERLARQMPEVEPTVDAPRGPGRPKLGVVSREISLLPRHWEWLAAQRGGASASLRRLIEDARKRNAAGDFIASKIDAAHRFLWDIAGDLPSFEEASRALYARDFERFEQLILAFPVDIQGVVLRYVGEAKAALGVPYQETPG